MDELREGREIENWMEEVKKGEIMDRKDEEL